MSRVTNLSEGIDRKAAQLEALLVMATTDELGELSDEIRVHYLWACMDLSTQIRSDFSGFRSLVTEKQGGEV